jgi:flagellar FliL protein
MAIEEVDELDAELEDEGGAERPRGGGKKKLVLLSLLGVVGLAAVGGGAYFAMGLLAGGADGEADVEGEQVAEYQEPAAAQDKGPPIYFDMEPPITVNFQREGRARFLQVSMSVMAREEKAIEHLEQHMPVVRNNLNMLFSSQDYAIISTREGKEALRQSALTEIQTVLNQRAGSAGVEEVYFTSFVMQ